MKTVTVFTPAYNRADLLPRCYNALKSQTSKDFVWLIVDDGSTDNTNELVAQWQKTEKEFEILYYYKKNGGLHTAYNVAIEKMNSELAVCIDSDDYMPEDGIETIVEFWGKNGSNKYAGITALDFNEKDGKIIGGYYPENQKSINLIDIMVGKYPSVWGDKKHVVRTELYKQVAPMPSFEGEKNFNPHCLHLEISKNYDFLILNKNLCFVDYQPDGMTNSILWQFYNSPNSFAEIRKLYLSFENTTLKFIVKNCIYYSSSCMLAKQKHYVRKCPKHKALVTALIPMGFLFSRYIKYKNRK